jgi:integrase
VAEGRYLKRQPRVKEVTVADLWPLWLMDYQNRGGKDERRWVLAWKHLDLTFGSIPVAGISTDLINRYTATRRTAGRDNGTINRELTLLRAMFNCGRRTTVEGTEGGKPKAKPLVTYMPAFPIRLKESEPRKGFVTDAEYARLAANAKELWLRALIAVAYTFGFRKGELLDLRVRQVDLMDRWIDLESGTTKNDDARKVKMTAEVFQLMLECVRGKNPDDHVFTREDGSRVMDPRKAWYNLCIKAGLGHYVAAKGKSGEYRRYVGLNLHDFRRSAVRNMTRRGVNDKTAMLISGHKTRSVFDRYNIGDEADLVRASELIERGQQARAPEVGKTDTKTDTSTFAVL